MHRFFLMTFETQASVMVFQILRLCPGCFYLVILSFLITLIVVYLKPLLNLFNQPIVFVDLFMINITPTIFYFRFIFLVYLPLLFKLICIILSPGMCSWQYHRWCLAGTQTLVCSVYCFLSCTFYVVTKKKNCIVVDDQSMCSKGNKKT